MSFSYYYYYCYSSTGEFIREVCLIWEYLRKRLNMLNYSGFQGWAADLMANNTANNDLQLSQ